MQTQTLLFIIMIGYFLLLWGVARLTKGKGENRDFFGSTRRSPWYLIAIGMIGASISGVSFISVPGMVTSIDMTYMQMVIGFFAGYIFITVVLLPLFYKLNLVSIYGYLNERFGKRAHISGASFFLLSKTMMAAVRLYLVVIILQQLIFDHWHIPFVIVAAGILLFIWFYSKVSGIQTLIYTDTLQTICMIGALLLIIATLVSNLDMGMGEAVTAITDSPHSKIWEWNDWGSKSHFIKQFFSGAFVTIVMTGLDQDMMQKNLACRNLKDARKNMLIYGFLFIPVNLLFLSLGVLITLYASKIGITLPLKGDDILPFIITQELGEGAIILFAIGIIAAAFSSADSALTSLTTSVCVDILPWKKISDTRQLWLRKRIHIGMTIVLWMIVILLNTIHNQSLIDTIYTVVSYTYGPLLGLYFLGLFTHLQPREQAIPYIAVASPLLSWVINYACSQLWGYSFGYELLLLNGMLTFIGLWCVSKKSHKLIVNN